MRVIAGAHGGRRLVAPKGRATRPTSDRVREAMFSMLGDVRGWTVLDLYAGSGALGLEALSRGAARSVFVEKNRAALGALRQNVATLDLGAGCEVIAAPVARTVKGFAGRAFDLVLIDPPYAQLDAAARELARLVQVGGALAPEALIVLEHATRDAAPSVLGLALDRTKKYGDTAVSCYVVAAPSGPVQDLAFKSSAH